MEFTYESHYPQEFNTTISSQTSADQKIFQF